MLQTRNLKEDMLLLKKKKKKDMHIVPKHKEDM